MGRWIDIDTLAHAISQIYHPQRERYNGFQSRVKTPRRARALGGPHFGGLATPALGSIAATNYNTHYRSLLINVQYQS